MAPSMNRSLDDDAYDLFEAFAWRLTETRNLAELTTRGLMSLRDQHALSEASDPARRHGAPVISITQQEDFLARREIQDGFPKTWGQTVIALWGHLETFASEFAIFMIEREPERFVKAFAEKKGGLGAYLAADEADRPAFLYEQLAKENSSGSTAKEGVAPFEQIFGKLGLAPGASDKVQIDLLHEWRQVRNLWAHRGGIADQRFLSACSSFGAQFSPEARVDADRAARYAKVGIAYAAQVYKRFIAQRGPSHENQEAVDSWLAD
jgi:hypothetical protein